MDWKKFVVTTVIAFVVMFMLGWVMHGMVLRLDYMLMADYNPHLMRTDEAAMQRMWVMAIGYLFFAAAMTWIYAQGISASRWVGQAVRYSIAIWAVATVPHYLITYTVLMWTKEVVMKQIAVDGVTVLVTGLVIGAMYRNQTTANRTRGASA